MWNGHQASQCPPPSPGLPNGFSPLPWLPKSSAAVPYHDGSVIRSPALMMQPFSQHPWAQNPLFTGVPFGLHTGYPPPSTRAPLSTPGGQGVSVCMDLHSSTGERQGADSNNSLSKAGSASRAKSCPFQGSFDIIRDYCLFRLAMESQPTEKQIRRESISFLRKRCPHQTVRDDCRSSRNGIARKGNMLLTKRLPSILKLRGR